MRRTFLALVIVLVLVLACIPAYAYEVDLHGMSTEELLELREEVNLALASNNGWNMVDDKEAVKVYEMALQCMEEAESAEGYIGLLRAYQIATYFDNGGKFESAPEIIRNNVGYDSAWTLLDNDDKFIQFITTVKTDESGKIWRNEVLQYRLRVVYKSGKDIDLYRFEAAEAMSRGFTDIGEKQVGLLLSQNHMQTDNNTTLYAASIDGYGEELYISCEIITNGNDDNIMLESNVVFDGKTE